MLFKVIKETEHGPRSGLLFENVETPALLTHTEAGAIPNLNERNQSDLDFGLVQLGLHSLANLKEVIQAYAESKEEEVKGDVGIADFLNHKGRTTFLTMTEAGKETSIGNGKKVELDLRYHDQKNIVKISEYLDLVKTFKPTFWATPSESILESYGKARRERAVKQARDFLAEFANGDQVDGSHLLGTVAIEPKYPKVSDILFTHFEDHADKLSGLFFQISSLSISKRQTMFDLFRQRVKGTAIEGKLRVAESHGDPISILADILNGVDLFESSFAYTMANTHKALVFDTVMPEDYVTQFDDPKELFDSFTAVPLNIDLSLPEFRDDSTPFHPTHQNYANTTINRAYIYHLIDCKEMNAEILLTIHNVQVMQSFMAQIREAIKGDKLHHYVEWFMLTQCKV